jgi:hypothetical protein
MLTTTEVPLLSRKERIKIVVRFQVLTAASMKITVFWDVAPCSLVEVRFRGARCHRHQGYHQAPLMEAVSTTEKSVNFY